MSVELQTEPVAEVQPPRPKRRARRLWLYPAAVAGLVAGAALLYWVPPGEDAWWYPKCYLHSVTGLHCPGCGTTRCFSALAHGDLAQAAAYNVFILTLMPVFGLWLVLRQLREWTGKRWLCPTLPNWVLYTLAVGSFVFGVVRNLPFEPFLSLAPHVLN
jgi:hypothetical protein